MPDDDKPPETPPPPAPSALIKPDAVAVESATQLTVARQNGFIIFGFPGVNAVGQIVGVTRIAAPNAKEARRILEILTKLLDQLEGAPPPTSSSLIKTGNA